MSSSAKSMPAAGECYLRTSSVAKRLSLHKQTVLKYAHDGLFGQFVRLGQEIRIPESGVNKFIKDRLV